MRGVGYAWVRAAIAYRTFVHGLNELATLEPERGVMFVVNHRTFFDQYVVTAIMFSGPAPWAQRLYFPVRSNFWYERPLGVLVNFAMSAGTMYPPIFRQADRSDLNRAAMRKIADLVSEPGAVVGMHPEGTRNRGGDPYSLLAAQPGAGEIAMKGRPVVIPVFINGLTNNFLYEIRASWLARIRTKPCICVFGEPMEYSDLTSQQPRPALYKEFSDRACQEIAKLSDTERQIRERCRRGLVSDDNPAWLSNRPNSRIYAFRNYHRPLGKSRVQ